MSHGRAGGIVPPLRCMHQEAVNPLLPSVCLWCLFPAKQTTRFPMRAPLGPAPTRTHTHSLYRHHSHMETLNTPFLKKDVREKLKQTKGHAINWCADQAITL